MRKTFIPFFAIWKAKALPIPSVAPVTTPQAPWETRRFLLPQIDT